MKDVKLLERTEGLAEHIRDDRRLTCHQNKHSEGVKNANNVEAPLQILGINDNELFHH
jgi:hypothetical protein